MGKTVLKKLGSTWNNNPVLFTFIVVAILNIIALPIIIDLVWNQPVSDEGFVDDRWDLTVGVIGAVGAFSVAIVGIVNISVNHRRANTAEKQQAQELFVSSIKNLGSREEIIRIGAIHGLERLAKDSPQKWGDKVAETLFKYIISTTSRPSYKIIYESKPAAEITTALEILTGWNENAK